MAEFSVSETFALGAKTPESPDTPKVYLYYIKGVYNGLLGGYLLYYFIYFYSYMGWEASGDGERPHFVPRIVL